MEAVDLAKFESAKARSEELADWTSVFAIDPGGISGWA